MTGCSLRTMNPELELRVALAQMAATERPDQNRRRVATLARQAAEAGAELVLFPECAQVLFEVPDLGAVAEDLDGPFVAELRELAVRHRMTIVAGMAERSQDDPRPFNTLVAVGTGGELLATYRKIHLYDSFGHRESDSIRPGPGDLSWFELQGLRIGLMTCYDLRFPELARLLAEAGAGLILCPAAWVRGPFKEEHWEILLRARAIENVCYMAATGNAAARYIGRSLLVDPMGAIRLGLPEGEELGVAPVTTGRIQKARATNPSLENRRIEVRPPAGDHRLVASP